LLRRAAGSEQLTAAAAKLQDDFPLLAEALPANADNPGE